MCIQCNLLYIVRGKGNLISRINLGCLEFLVYLFPLPKVLKLAANFLNPFYILRSSMHDGSALHKYVTNPKTKWPVSLSEWQV